MLRFTIFLFCLLLRIGTAEYATLETTKAGFSVGAWDDGNVQDFVTGVRLWGVGGIQGVQFKYGATWSQVHGTQTGTANEFLTAAADHIIGATGNAATSVTGLQFYTLSSATSIFFGGKIDAGFELDAGGKILYNVKGDMTASGFVRNLIFQFTTPIDCVGSWSAFGSCSVTCGSGVQSQQYKISTFQVGGKVCPSADKASRSQVCAVAPCAVNCAGTWSSYGPCSKTCGGGSQTQTFTIATPAAFGGVLCEKTNGYVQSQLCNSNFCPVNCVGSWGAFGACSITCGGGVRARKYRIDQPALYGGAQCSPADGTVETASCNLNACPPPPVACVGSWTPYSGCSKSCGNGQQTRTHRISVFAANGGKSCEAGDGQVQTISCNSNLCPVDCVGGWGVWGGCNAVCGQGIESRRFAISVSAANGGKLCAAANGQTETRICSTIPCPVACVGSWSPYGPCSAVCGGGSQTRVYTVSQPAVSGGKQCEAGHNTVAVQSCNPSGCPVDCIGSWGNLGRCTDECGGGYQTRTFQTIRNSANGGASCGVNNGQVSTQSCNAQACPANQCAGGQAGAPKCVFPFIWGLHRHNGCTTYSILSNTPQTAWCCTNTFLGICVVTYWGVCATCVPPPPPPPVKWYKPSTWRLWQISSSEVVAPTSTPMAESHATTNVAAIVAIVLGVTVIAFAVAFVAYKYRARKNVVQAEISKELLEL